MILSGLGQGPDQPPKGGVITSAILVSTMPIRVITMPILAITMRRSG